MQTVTDINNYNSEDLTAIALGTFDGLHKAHKKVIESVCESGYLPAVFTFQQSPAGIIKGETIHQLSTRQMKQKAMEKLGVELYICPDFNDIRDLTPEEFVLMLKKTFNAKQIVCGYNFHFGVGGQGTAGTLKELCRKYRIKMQVIEPVLDDFTPVSSTVIRSLIENGDIKKANELLGDAFSYEFEVVEGNHIGSTLDLPTINQQFPVNFIIPKFGVYASKTLVDGKVYKSVTNIGIKPTIGSDYPSSETFILDFSGDLYKQNITVALYEFLREERKFEDLEELKNAIENNVKTVKEMDY